MMKRALFIFSFIILLLSGCEKWLDVNVDPNKPSDVQLNQIFPGVFYDIGDDLGIGYSRIGYVCAVYVHQLTTRESHDQYGVTGGSYAMTNYWSDLFASPLPMLDILIGKAEETDNLYYAGIGKVMKAYLVSQMVDVWGDIPYTKANESGEYNPVFDDDQEIYQNLFTLLDAGLADLKNTDSENLLEPGDDDLIYGGDIDTWIKVANTIKLKLYNQVRNVSMYNAAAVSALVANDGENLIGSGEDFWIPFGPSVAPDNRNPAFVSEYSGAQISNYISPWFYELMIGENDNILQAIADPRVPYYFANQLAPGETTENPPEYMNGDFVSIYFGSVGTNRDHGGRNTFTMMGLYPCGGAYDLDPGLNKTRSLGITAGTGAAPYKMITAADVLYIRAELAKVGNTTEDARALLEQAMYASFEQVDVISAIAALPSTTVPDLSGSGSDTAYVDAVLAQYDADAGKQLEHIMTQKWIAAFGSSIDSYTDYRRTGYPVIFDPNTMGSVADGGPDGSGMVPVTSGRTYAVSLPWSADELALNSSAPAQKLIASARIFWDVD